MSSGPGEATLLTTVVSLDPIYAYVRRRRADLPAVRRDGSQGRWARRRQAALPIRMALASDDDFPHRGQAGLPRQPARSGDRHDSRPRGLPQRRRQPDAGPLRPPAAPGRRSAHGLLIQDRAVGTDLDKRFVFVVDAGHDDRVPRGRRSARSSTAARRAAGVNAGDLVVVNGLQRVRPGVKVEPVVVAMDEPVVPAEPRQLRWQKSAHESGAEVRARMRTE